MYTHAAADATSSTNRQKNMMATACMGYCCTASALEARDNTTKAHHSCSLWSPQKYGLVVTENYHSISNVTLCTCISWIWIVPTWETIVRDETTLQSISQLQPLISTKFCTRQMHSIVGASLIEARGVTDIGWTPRVACYAAKGEQLQMWNHNEMCGIDSFILFYSGRKAHIQHLQG